MMIRKKKAYNKIICLIFLIILGGLFYFFRYVPYADDSDEENGHGSHVAGSVLGEMYSTSEFVNTEAANYHGIAPKAKMAFTDIGVAGKSSLDVPSDLNAKLFPWPYTASARIHTNSWGALSNDYLSNDLEVDKFTHNHPDFLVLFAAGEQCIMI